MHLYPWDLELNNHCIAVTQAISQASQECFGTTRKLPNKEHMSSTVMDMIRIRRGAKRALRRWFGDLCVDASLSHHLATLSRFAARVSRGDLSSLCLDSMPTSFLELFQILRFSAQLHMQGALSSDDFA
eukprot:8382711-Pyramimonas_sp.AAC.1